MSITFNIVSFDSRYALFKQSLKESCFDLPEHLYMETVCLFLGYSSPDHLKKNVEIFKASTKTQELLNSLKNVFTTSLSSHEKGRKNILTKLDNGQIIFEEEALKKYTYQQFKKGISQASAYLKSNGVDISQSSLLKAFSIFLGYTNWNTLSSVIKNKTQKAYNVFAPDYSSIIESAFLALEEGVETVYFVDLDASYLVQEYLKQVNTLKHKYKVPFKEILKVKRISKKEINDTIFDGRSVCFISDNDETNLYIFNRFIKNNKKYELV